MIGYADVLKAPSFPKEASWARRTWPQAGRHPEALWTIVQHNDLVAGIQELRRYY